MTYISINKVCALLLAVVLILGLTGCGEHTSATSASTPAPTGTAAEAAPEATETAEVSQPAAGLQLAPIEKILTLITNEPLNVNGKELLYSVICEDITESGEAYLSYGDEAVDLGFAEYPCDSFVVVLEDGTFIVYTTLGFSSDWYETIPVLVKDGEITVYEGAEGAIASEDDILSCTNCILQTRDSVFGTYGVTIPYELTNQGLTQLGSYVTIINNAQTEDGSYFDDLSEYNPITSAYDTNGRRILTLKCDLTLSTDNGDVVLPAGTVIYPIGFDPVKKKFYVEYDGGEGYFNYTDSSKGWGNSIEGKDEEECFEYLAYAG